MASPECRKFAPNIFNKSKCSNCFRLKEDHSASAIQLNKASRKISKCGYLFVAPDWDFSNPVNRTKRWQRRWFVLYDDGELTYSVDDHPETIPQACIDMNRVMEVARADEVTGNPHSVAITAPERVHFVKGTCKEESNWWLEVLQIFPRSSVKSGRAKRNATFPGGIATTYIAQYTGTTLQTPPVKCDTAAETEKTAEQSSALGFGQLVPSLAEPSCAESTVSLTACNRKELNGTSPGMDQSLEVGSRSQSSTPVLEVAGRFKKIKAKTGEGTRAYRSLRSNTCENLSAIPQDYGRSKLYRYQNIGSDPYLDAPTNTSTPVLRPDPLRPDPQCEPRPDLSAVLRPDQSSALPPTKLSTPPPSLPPESPILRRNDSTLLRSSEPISPILRQSTEADVTLDCSFKAESSSAGPTPDTSYSDALASPPSHNLSPLTDLPVRGVPDGCGLEIHSSIPPPSPHELLNLKKGWLMKQGLTTEWQKHWFVLQGSALMYFRDPGAENSGLMDGIIDLGLVQKVEERDVQRNYGFVVCTLDDREYVLSAVTHGIRNNWINALKSASNLNSLPESDTPKLQRRDAFDAEIRISRISTSDSIALPPASINHTAPEIGTKIRPADTSSAAPVSPPLNRTPTSKVKKEKTRSVRSLKSSQSLACIALTSSGGDSGSAKLLIEEEFSMIPERDVSAARETKTLDSTNTEFFVPDPASLSDVELEAGVEAVALKVALKEANLVLVRQTTDINNLRKRLDNMNSDMDATLKNLNTEQVRNSELERKIQDIEQENGLLQVKTVNAEKSLREQSKEITSLNQRVREFTDLSTQYKAQVAENKTLRQKLEKMERMNTGPNWKSLYESLQAQHQKERVLWEDKLKEMELEVQTLLETHNEAEQKGHLISDLSHQLQESETRINQLLCQNDTLEREGSSFKQTYEEEINRLKENVKELEEYIDKTDKSQEDSNKDSEILRLRKELSDKSKLEKDLQELQSELVRSQEDAESLREKLRNIPESPEKELFDRLRSRSLCSSRDNLDRQLRLVRMDSLSELMAALSDPEQVTGMSQEQLVHCYTDLTDRFNKAISEIRALKLIVKKWQGNADELEIKNIQLNQTLCNTQAQHSDQMSMMSNKIEDLTSKYMASERQVRNFKLKLKGAEGKERRRSSTGIRPDELLVQREAESVLGDIETSLSSLEGFVRGKDVVKDLRKKSYETSTKASRARRRSAENCELTFVERLKKTEKSISEMNRKLSSHGDHRSVFLDCLRKQLLGLIARTKDHLSESSFSEVQDLLSTLESVISSSELPAISTGEEPGFPAAEGLSSHLDTVMTYLYRSVEQVYETRREGSQMEQVGAKMCTGYEVGDWVCSSAEMARLVEMQTASLQAYLLMDLQYQVNTVQTRFFAFNREQTLKDYNDATKSLLLKVLESKHFVPLSSYSCKKLKALSSVSLSRDSLATMFRRLKREAQALFARISSVTSELIQVFVDSVLGQMSEKELILEGIKSEVYNMVEEDERLREFQTSLVNIYLACSDCEAGKDPERVNLMANREEALQSQSEVTRILVDQEIHDFAAALEAKLVSEEIPPSNQLTTKLGHAENLTEVICQIASMVSQKCVTEAQITILNTILGLEDGPEDGNEAYEDGQLAPMDDFVFNPENMNNECNEFMIVLNNYRQTQTKTVVSKCKLSLTGQSGSSLESNLKSIRRENESKKARLSAALSEKKSSQEDKFQDLRQWCEKSMSAMEKSYENLLNELQIQHSKEKESLKREKEQALAEETRATLSALDAMRKAHESEVQKEVEKFKKEFLSELRSKECIGALQSEYQEDREEIRREIMSVTAGDGWQDQEEAATRPARLTRSPSCPRLYSTLSLSTSRSTDHTRAAEEPLKSPLTGMVANRKRVFETEY